MIVEADAGFAAKQTLKLINEREWGYVFGLARTWKLEDDTYLINLARHTTKACYHRYASHKPDGQRKDYSRLPSLSGCSPSPVMSRSCSQSAG